MLNTRTSRSRIGEELNKMLNGNDPLKACEYLYDLNLYKIVFARPPENTVVTIRSALSKAQVKEIQDHIQKKGKSKKEINTLTAEQNSQKAKEPPQSSSDTNTLISPTEEKIIHLTQTVESVLSTKDTKSDIDITIGLKAVRALNK